jgi:putative ABC transport system permease protein
LSLYDDLRYAVRSLRKSPSFAAVTLATLALGIGANTALYSVVNAVLLRPLPYDHPERIAVVWRTTPESREQPHAAGDYVDVARDSRSFESLAAVRGSHLDLVTQGGDPQRVLGAEVTSAFFDVFGMPAALGRPLRADLDRPGDRRVVLSHGLWQRVFGSDPSVVGQSLRMGSQPLTVVGVMPPGFAWPPDAEAWALADRAVPSSPIALPDEPERHRGLSYLNVVARRRADVSWNEAQAELDALGRRLAEAFPENNKDRGYALVPLHQQLTGHMRPSLLALLGVVGLVLVIAAANVASLLLARGLDRRRELAVRTSLGASPARLARQLLAESVVLSVLGGVLGLGLADQGTRLLIRLLPEDLPRSGEVAIDASVLLFALVVSVGTGLLFGLAPALEAGRVPPADALHAGGRSTTPGGRLLRSALVVGQIAVCLVVLSGAGLLLRSFVRLHQVDTGFASSVVAASLPQPASRYATPAEQARLYAEVVERLSASGRYEAAAGYPAPFGDGAASAAPVRRENERTADVTGMTLFSTVTPAYFRVLGIPLLSGRGFTEADEEGQPGVVVVSQALAARLWPGADPLGQRVTLGSDELFTVVGIVGDVRRKGLDQPAEPMVYLSYRQFSLPLFTVFASGPAETLPGDLRAAVRAVDPELPLGPLETMTELRARSTAEPRLRTVIVGLFGGLGLALAAVGLYGVVSDGVRRRAREMGIRMALGAEKATILRLIVRDGLRLSLLGGALGLAASLMLGRVIQSFLFGTSAADPLTLSGVVSLLVGVSLLATCLPARAAARTDPASVMRAE